MNSILSFLVKMGKNNPGYQKIKIPRQKTITPKIKENTPTINPIQDRKEKTLNKIKETPEFIELEKLYEASLNYKGNTSWRNNVRNLEGVYDPFYCGDWIINWTSKNEPIALFGLNPSEDKRSVDYIYYDPNKNEWFIADYDYRLNKKSLTRKTLISLFSKNLEKKNKPIQEYTKYMMSIIKTLKLKP